MLKSIADVEASLKIARKFNKDKEYQIVFNGVESTLDEISKELRSNIK